MGTSYYQFCPVSKAMELLDERWTLLVLRELPGGRTVVQFRFPDLPAKVRDWWLVITPGEADVCDTDPGYPVAVTLTATLRHMTQIWRGDLSWPESLRTGVLEVHGQEKLRRAAPGWFTLSPFASVPRVKP